LGKRLQAFHNQTQPVIDFYKEKGKLVDVNANQDMDVVTDAIRKGLN